MPINSTKILNPESLVPPREHETELSILEKPQSNQELPIASLELASRKNGENLSAMDKLLEKLGDKTVKFRAKHGHLFNQIISTGNKLSVGTNLTATAAEPNGIKQFGPASRLATAANLVLTGVKGTEVGLAETRDPIYAFGKASDALIGMLPMIPQEWQFALRIGPSLSNFATAIRQEAGVDRYENFSDAFKLAGKEIGKYLKNVRNIGYIKSFKPENSEKSRAYSVGAPLQAFAGSLLSMISFVPLIPKSVQKLLRSVGYLNRFAGAATIDLYEGMSQNAKSQFSGAAKLNFLGGAVSDIVNKLSQVGKWATEDKLKLSENSTPVQVLNWIETFTKNLTPALESLGRVNNETAIKKGINNPRYKVTGFKGIMSRYTSSVLESMLGIPAQRNSEEEVSALEKKETTLRGEVPEENKTEIEPGVDKQEPPLAKTKVKPTKLKYNSHNDNSIYDNEHSYTPVKKLSLKPSIIKEPVLTVGEKPAAEGKPEVKAKAQRNKIKIEMKKAEIRRRIQSTKAQTAEHGSIGEKLNQLGTSTNDQKTTEEEEEEKKLIPVDFSNQSSRKTSEHAGNQVTPIAINTKKLST